MDLARTAEYSLRLQHRHNDGSWSPLEPRDHHDPAEHDPERDWATGSTIYVCKACGEEVLIETLDAAGDPRS